MFFPTLIHFTLTPTGTRTTAALKALSYMLTKFPPCRLSPWQASSTMSGKQSPATRRGRTRRVGMTQSRLWEGAAEYADGRVWPEGLRWRNDEAEPQVMARYHHWNVDYVYD